jgi:hypothetical protein
MSAAFIASIDAQQSRGHGPIFSQQNVEGAHGCTRGHRVGRDARFAKPFPELARQGLQGLAGSNKQNFNRVSFDQETLEIGFRQGRTILRLPAVDAGRQAKNGPSMGHISEAEAAIAIGVDGRTAREVCLAYLDPLRHPSAL